MEVWKKQIFPNLSFVGFSHAFRTCLKGNKDPTFLLIQSSEFAETCFRSCEFGCKGFDRKFHRRDIESIDSAWSSPEDAKGLQLTGRKLAKRSTGVWKGNIRKAIVSALPMDSKLPNANRGFRVPRNSTQSNQQSEQSGPKKPVISKGRNNATYFGVNKTSVIYLFSDISGGQN